MSMSELDIKTRQVTTIRRADCLPGLLALLLHEAADCPNRDTAANKERQPERNRGMHELHGIEQHPQAAKNEHARQDQGQFGDQHELLVLSHAIVWPEGHAQGNAKLSDTFGG
jgi:hypothetical protein